MKNNNDNNSKKRKIALIVLFVLLALVVVGSGVAIGVFRIAKGNASGNGDKKAFTDKLTTESTTQVAKATTEKVTTEKATKALTEKVTTEKAKKVANVCGGITTEAKNGSTKATTQATTQAVQPDTEAPTPSYDPQPATEAPAPTPATEAPKPQPTTERATEAPTTQHQHSWEAITETTTEKVKVKDAWDEEVEYYKCSYCGARATEVGGSHIGYCGRKVYDEDFGEWGYEGASWVSGWDTVHHDAVYKDKEVTKTVGYKCTTCGATK